MYNIFIISDGTGRTAEQFLNAALTQYQHIQVDLYRRPNVRTEDQILEIIQEAAVNKGFVVHTIVSKEMRDKILLVGRLHDVDTIDLMGPFLGHLSHQFSNLPTEIPGLFRKLNKAYFQRIESMEFAFRHDDGQRVHELHNAEIVLVGVSRTFKTPLSIYLAFKGWLVANVPIVYGITPPLDLSHIPAERVFGLYSESLHLTTLRKVRDEHLGGMTGEYATIKFVKKELDYSKKIFTDHPGWKTINVTKKPIEEIASEILSYLRKNHFEGNGRF